MRRLMLAGLTSALVTCADEAEDTGPVAGRILAIVNVDGSNALALDAELDATDDFLLGAVQRGEANYGTGIVGRALEDAPVVVLSRRDPSFQPIWVKVLDAAFESTASVGISEGPEGDVLAFTQGYAGALDLGDGVAHERHVVARLAQADGAPVWTRQLDDGGAADPYEVRLHDVVADPQGRAVVFGDATLPGTSGRIYLARLAAADGATEDVEIVTSAGGGAQAHDFELDGAGNVLVAGGFEGVLTLDRPLDAAGEPSAFVAKLGATALAPTWSLRVRLADAAAHLQIAAAQDGDVLVAGAMELDPAAAAPSAASLRVARLDGVTGTLLWQSRIDVSAGGTLGLDDLRSTPGDDVVVLGNFVGAMQIGDDAINGQVRSLFLSKLDGADGLDVWARYSRGSPTWPARVDVDVEGNSAAFGTFDKVLSESQTLREIFFIFVAP